ncbi:MAG TPA: CHASE domain-containing protein [Baekduia sp.]|nr:CHASE domain-containing protein [Baekduia sp.]
MRRASLGRLGPAILLAALLAMTGVATWAAARRSHDRERDELVADAHGASAALDRRLQEYVQVLRGAAGLYAASERVGYDEFEQYFADQGVLERFPGVQVIGFASYVARGDLAAYAARVRRDSARAQAPYPAFHIHPRPAPDAEAALVIDHLDPPAGNAQAFGLDFLSEPSRRRAALLARRTGMPASTAPIRLVQAATGWLGIDLMVPVYAGPPSTTGEQRPWGGVVYAAFRLDDLLREVIGDQRRDADVQVYDLGPAATVGPRTRPGPNAIPFDPARAGKPPPAGSGTRTETIEVAGRRWAIAYTRRGSALAAGERAVPWIIGTAGLIVSLLAAALLRALSTSQARAVRLADAMTVELREREAELQRSNAELEHFAYLASHDLQEPLRTITSYVGLLQRRAGDQLDERASGWLGFVGEGAERMSHLIADLLEYSRSGRAAEPAQPVALDEAWDVAVANLRGAIEEAGATVTRDPLPVVLGRPRELTSVLQNLIGNGLKYRDATAPLIHASAHRLGGAWEIHVRDNGIGIEPRFHDRVFGLFQRLHTADRYPGTGMGLAIVKKIVEANGGAIRVDSRAGEGATFIVTLPAEQA